MTSSFARNLKIVTGVHIALIACLFASGWFKGCSKPKKDVVIPLEFLVEVPASVQSQPDDGMTIPAKDPVVKKPIKKPVKKPVKKPIKISDKVVSNPNIKKPVKPLTPEEIQKLLAQGAKPSDRTVIPDDDTIHFAMVKQAFHDAWVQPSITEAGDAVVEVEIKFAGDGTVVGARLKTASGVSVMDASVEKALKYVKRVSGLTSDFLERHGTITISFRVE